MDETFSTQAIIINNRPFREHDSMVSAYSRERGKLDLVARGARKIGSKLAGHLQPVSLARIMVVRGKHFNYIGGADCLRGFRNIKDDWRKIVLAGKAMAVFGGMIKGEEPDMNLFELVRGYLELLERTKEPLHNFYHHSFVFKLLVNSGYGPELYECVVCRQPAVPRGNYFSPERGGVVCARCHAGLAASVVRQPVSPPAIKTMRLLARLAISDLPRFKIEEKPGRELAGIITSFHAYHCG